MTLTRQTGQARKSHRVNLYLMKPAFPCKKGIRDNRCLCVKQVTGKAVTDALNYQLRKRALPPETGT
jgi:hypothetical protein